MYADISRFGFTLTVDLHGLTVDEARKQLSEIINKCDNTVEEIEVIHGYSNGSALRGYVRNQLKHKRITQKIISMNQGVTVLKIAKRQSI